MKTLFVTRGQKKTIELTWHLTNKLLVRALAKAYDRLTDDRVDRLIERSSQAGRHKQADRNGQTDNRQRLGLTAEANKRTHI